MALNTEAAAEIVAIVGRLPDGATLAEIAQTLFGGTDERKVQRWLKMLVEGQYLATNPNEIPIRYHAVSTAEPTEVTTPLTTSATTPVTASTPAVNQANAASIAPALPNGAPPTTPVQAPTAAPPQAPAAIPQPTSSTITPSTTAVSGLDPDFEPMFDLAWPTLVSAGMTKPAVIVSLQSQAVRNRKTGPAIKAYVDYARSRLERLTLSDVEALGLTADQFALWQRRYRA